MKKAASADPTTTGSYEWGKFAPLSPATTSSSEGGKFVPLLPARRPLAAVLLPCHCGLTTEVRSPASNHFLLLDYTSTTRRGIPSSPWEKKPTRQQYPQEETSRRVKLVADPVKLLSCPYKRATLVANRVRVYCPKELMLVRSMSSRRTATKPGPSLLSA